MWTSTVLTAAIGTNWVTTLRISTVHVGDLGSYVTVQLNYRSLPRSGSACFAFWLARAALIASHGELEGPAYGPVPRRQTT